MSDLRTIPHSRAAEAAVLGSMMVDATCIDSVVDGLCEADFYIEEHRTLYATIVAVHAAGATVTGAVVRVELERIGKLESIGGIEFLREVVETTVSSASVAYHAAVVREHGARRAIIASAHNVLTQAYDGTDLATLADSAGKAFSAATDRAASAQSTDGVPMIEALGMAYSRLEQDAKYPLAAGPVMGRLSPGFQAGQMVVVCGRPGHGKTALGLHMCLEGLRRAENTKALFISYEMTPTDLVTRVLSLETGIPYEDMNNRDLAARPGAYEKIVEASRYLQRYNLLFVGGGDPTAERAVALARKHHRESPLAAVFVDYVQRMSVAGKYGNRNEEVSRISNVLKNLTLELEIPVFVLAQLNRSCDQRDDHRPRESDVRESGTIEQDADVIISVMRPDKYENDYEKHTQTAFIEIIKQRNGPEGRIEVGFDGPVMRFYNRAEDSETPFTPTTPSLHQPKTNLFKTGNKQPEPQALNQTENVPF